MNTKIQFSMLTTAAAFALTGCLAGQNQQFFEPVPSVCDALGAHASGLDRSHGVKGKMFFFDDADLATQPHALVSDYFKNGHLAKANFYFDNFYVPPRAFDQGFQLPDGSLLKKSDGTPLIENFAFDFKTNIKLPAGSAAKQYQFALLSDDGSNLLIQDPITHAWSTHLNNDGVHPSVYKCGQTPITVSDQPTPIELQYFQGPRYEISMVLMWRPWNGNASETYCDARGGSTFFDESTSPSRPQPAWLDILTRWEVVPGNMLYVDANEQNPCNH